MDLAGMLQADQDMQVNQENRDQFWDDNLECERQKIKKNREEHEKALPETI